MKRRSLWFCFFLGCGSTDGAPVAELAPVATVDLAGGTARASLVSPDLTGDGVADLLVSGQDINGFFYQVIGGPLDSAPTPYATLLLGATIVHAVDLDDDGANDLVASAHLGGAVYALRGPLAPGVIDRAQVISELVPHGSFPAVDVAIGRAGFGRALVVGTPGEPEEACSAAGAPVVLGLPLPAAGRLDQVAQTRVVGLDPFSCPGATVAFADLTGDGMDDLVIVSTRAGAWLFFGPIGAGDLDVAQADLILPASSGTYGGYLGTQALVLDFDDDGDRDLLLVDERDKAPILRAFAAPLSATTDPAAAVVLSVPSTARYILDGVYDFDGDGHGDIVRVDDQFGPSNVEISLGPLAAGLGRTATLTDVQIVGVTAGNVAGDARDELVVNTSSRATIYRLQDPP